MNLLRPLEKNLRIKTRKCFWVCLHKAPEPLDWLYSPFTQYKTKNIFFIILILDIVIPASRKVGMQSSEPEGGAADRSVWLTVWSSQTSPTANLRGEPAATDTTEVFVGHFCKKEQMSQDKKYRKSKKFLPSKFSSLFLAEEIF